MDGMARIMKEFSEILKCLKKHDWSQGALKQKDSPTAWITRVVFFF
jgi:hypothetical protein